LNTDTASVTPEGAYSANPWSSNQMPPSPVLARLYAEVVQLTDDWAWVGRD
jgi:hypothetical protein